MNKPATKEPSMDEILSSIRQIIADDDASAAPPAPPAPAMTPTGASPVPRPVLPPAQRPSVEPLALSPAQIVPEPPEPKTARDFASMLADLDEPEGQPIDPIAPFDTVEAQLVDPEDVAFESDTDPQPPSSDRSLSPEARQPAPEPYRAPRAVAQAAPMPDPTLSGDLAEQLLAPATDAAFQANMARLAAVASPGIGGLTVEAMMREMLRPMLKDWLDENLPSLVERMVEKEIARVSRGVK